MLQEFLDLFYNEKEIAKLRNDSEALRGEIAGKISPYKVGETTTVKGYSHTGKKCVITEVICTYTHYSNWRPSIDLKIKANVLNKDGKPSAYTADWGSQHDQILKHILSPYNEHIKNNYQQ